MLARTVSLATAIAALACFVDTPPADLGTTKEEDSKGSGVGTSGVATSQDAASEVGSCGDGVVQAGEECDQGPRGSGACTDLCTLNVCGDGYIGQGESCDDRTPTCILCQLETCGDGQLGPGEGCDDGNQEGGDQCTNACTVATCGDSFVWAEVEECDDGNTRSDDGCSATCTQEFCGDMIQQAKEECDDGNLDDLDACLSDCTSNKCGDGVLSIEMEECDHGVHNHDDPLKGACTTSCKRMAYLVFVTSKRFFPMVDFANIKHTEQHCTDAAASGLGLKGTVWKTWMSTDAVPPAINLFPALRPYVHVHDQIAVKVANNFSGLFSGSLLAPIQVTETGELLTDVLECDPNNLVWTGTHSDGGGGPDCADWTSSSNNLSATAGSLVRKDTKWTDANCGVNAACSSAARFYCIEQPSL